MSVEILGVRFIDSLSYGAYKWIGNLFVGQNANALLQSFTSAAFGPSGPPAIAANQAVLVLEALVGASLIPARVALTADRAIAFVFFDGELIAGGAHRRVATLTCSEDGLSALLEDRQSGQRRVWDVEDAQLPDSLSRIKDFVAGK